MKKSVSAKAALKTVRPKTAPRKTTLRQTTPRKRILLSTKERTLVAAQGLLQRYGYQGFSFQHLADIVGVKKPSLYEHFPSKELLGEALIESYFVSFQKWTKMIEVVSPSEKVMAYFDIFFKFACDQRKFCPLTALIPECNGLPVGMKNRLKKMHRFQIQWLTAVIQSGKRTKSFKSKEPDQQLADMILAWAYGAQMASRISNDPATIQRACAQALKLLKDD